MLPLKDRVVMRQLKAPEKTAGGLIIPVGAKPKPNLAIVLHVGPEVKEAKIDDMVVLGTKWYTNFDLGGDELLILNEPDLFAILEPAERAKAEAEYGR